MFFSRIVGFFSLLFPHGSLCGQRWLSISHSLPSPSGSFRLFLIYNPPNLQFPWYLPSTRDVSKPYEVTEGSSVSPAITERHQQRGTGPTVSFSLFFHLMLVPLGDSPCVSPRPTVERANPSMGSASSSSKSPHRPPSHLQHLLRRDNLGATTPCRGCSFPLAATPAACLVVEQGGRREGSTVTAQTTPAKPRGLSAAMHGGKSQRPAAHLQPHGH